MDYQYTYLFKYIIVGDTAVGKSCLMMQYIEGNFRSKHELTIGVEFGTKTIQHQGKVVKLQIWDTAGQENFRSLTRSYYRAAVGAVLVYDITSRSSFNDLDKWLEDLKVNSPPHAVITLIGNKNDQEGQRKVAYEEGENYAKTHGLKFFEVSAKNPKSVEEAFMEMTAEIFDKVQKGTISVINENSGVKLGSENVAVSDVSDAEDKGKKGKGVNKEGCNC